MNRKIPPQMIKGPIEPPRLRWRLWTCCSCVAGLAEIRLGGLGWRLQLGDEGVGAGGDPAGKVVGAETGQDRVADDLAGQRVGQDAFHAVADLDPDLVLGRRDEKDDAVIGALLADMPGAAEADAIFLDVVALEARDGGDDELAMRRRLERRQLLGQLGLLRRLQQIGGVDHPAGQRRKGLRQRRRGEEEGGKEQQERRAPSARRPSRAGRARHAAVYWPLPKSTVGAC